MKDVIILVCLEANTSEQHSSMEIWVSYPSRLGSESVSSAPGGADLKGTKSNEVYTTSAPRSVPLLLIPLPSTLPLYMGTPEIYTYSEMKEDKEGNKLRGNETKKSEARSSVFADYNRNLT